MRSNDIKALTEEMENDYQDYYDTCIENDMEPVDIFEWVAREVATAQEEMNEYHRDEGIPDE